MEDVGKRFIDHCTSSTGKWKDIFKMCEESSGAITRSYLESLHIGSGYSAWALAEDLDNFIVKYLSDDIYERREAWSGGEATALSSIGACSKSSRVGPR